jgi:glycerol kinase
MRETTALGAAIAAGFATGVWKEFEDLKATKQEKNRTIFKPNTDEASRDGLYTYWKKAVERSKGWLDNDRADDKEFE